MGAVAHLVHVVALRDVPVSDPVAAGSGSDLDDRHVLVVDPEFELLSGC